MIIQSAQYGADSSGYPFCDARIDGVAVRLSPYSLKRTLVDQGIVSLSPEFDGVASANLPARPEWGQPARILDGATDDPAVLALARQFLADLDSGQFQPGRTLI